jgi:hypothetical protein
MVEILRSPPAPRGFLIGPLILAAVIGLVALAPTPWFIRLGAVALALLTAWVGVFFALPPPWLAMDDKGFTVRRRWGRPRRVAWTEVEHFELGRTPKLAFIWRALIFIPAFVLATATSAGLIDGDITDTSRPAIGWRRRGSERSGLDGWIIDAYGLSQDALLAHLNGRLDAQSEAIG